MNKNEIALIKDASIANRIADKPIQRPNKVIKLGKTFAKLNDCDFFEP